MRKAAADEEDKREVEDLTLRLAAAEDHTKQSTLEVTHLTLRLSNTEVLCAKCDRKMIKVQFKFAASVAEFCTSRETA